MTTEWLNRYLMAGPYLCLVTSREEFVQALADIGCNDDDACVWVPEGSDGCMHTVKSKDPGSKDHQCCIVALRIDPRASPIQIAGLMVHEAVHVFQRYCLDMGEKNPSSEFEAYSIQKIAQRLMQSYADRINPTEPAA